MADDVARLVAVLEAQLTGFTKGMDQARAIADQRFGQIERRMRQSEQRFNQSFGNVGKLGSTVGSAFDSLSQKLLAFFTARRVLAFGENIFNNFDKITQSARDLGIAVDQDLVGKVAESQERWKETWIKFQLNMAGPVAGIGELLSTLLESFVKDNPLKATIDELNHILRVIDQIKGTLSVIQGGAGKEGVTIPIAPFDIAAAQRNADALRQLRSQSDLINQSELPPKAFDEFIGKLKLATDLAKLDVVERDRADALIEAANEKLKDQGLAGQVIISSLKQANDLLSAQEIKQIDINRALKQEADIIGSIEKIKADAAARAGGQAGVPAQPIADDIKKRNLEAIDAAFKVSEKTRDQNQEQQIALDTLKQEVDLAGILPRKREEENELLRLRQKYSDEFVDSNEEQIRQLVQQRQAAEDFAAIQQQAIDGFASIGADALTGAKNVQQAFSDMLRSLAAYIIKLELAKGLEAALGFFGLSVPTPAAIPGRAAGGPVSAGQAVIVGENRPELFVPNSSGFVYPGVPNASRGSGSSNLYIDARGAQIGVAEQIQSALTRAFPVFVGASVKQVSRNFPSMMMKAQRDNL